MPYNKLNDFDTRPPCEAEARNRQALYELELQWGAGKLDLGKLRRILNGGEQCEHEPERITA